MKKILLLIMMVMTQLNLISQEISLDKKPEPFSELNFPFPEYSVETLSNGLKLFIIQDKEQPTVAFRLMIKGGTSVDNSKNGVSELTASILTKGTKNRTSFEISSTIDGVGANLSASAAADNITLYASCLKKHQILILDVMTDVLFNPSFPKDEFEKLQKHLTASIQYEKSNPAGLAQALARIAVYGDKHPYSQRNTEETVNALKLQDLKDYYAKWFIPNNATLAIIGDVDKNQIISTIEKYFKQWNKAETPIISMKDPETKPLGVYFVSRPGSVQSSIVVTTNTVPYANIDYERLNLASNVMGAFSGRLFNTLREKYSYTYTPYGYQTRTKFTNRFACGADVKSDKTDASIKVIFEQLSLLSTTTPEDVEITRMKQYTLGSYLMALENSSYVAALIQNADFMGIQLNEATEYPKRLNSMTPIDVRSAAQDFMNPSKALIIVVGDPNIKETLAKFGNIFEYDIDLNPMSGLGAKMEKVNITAEKLISNYIDAIGGKSEIESVETMTSIGESEINFGGQVISGEITTKKMKDGKMHQKSDFRVYSQEIWVDGKKAWNSSFKDTFEIKDTELVKMIFEAKMFHVAILDKSGFQLEVLGKIKDNILLSAKNKFGEDYLYYFDSKTFLVKKKETIVNGPNGNELWTEIYDDYQKINNIMFPKVIKSVSPTLNTKTTYSYQLNNSMDDEIFNPYLKK
jgi:predicted Zn-dependent peptidase